MAKYLKSKYLEPKELSPLEKEFSEEDLIKFLESRGKNPDEQLAFPLKGNYDFPPLLIGLPKKGLEDKFSQAGIVGAVRSRLQQWADYHEHRSILQPGPAYSAIDKAADEIFEERRRITFSIRIPNPRLDLSISDKGIILAYERSLGE